LLVKRTFWRGHTSPIPPSKSAQDGKGWIEGWEPRIKADEFIHGLGIGEAYLRHNGRPAKVKLIRADINPPENFDLSACLPRFSQGNEPPLNLTVSVSDLRNLRKYVA
jgi:hypothetical protein